MTYQELAKKVKTHVCAMCGGELVVIWDSDNDMERLCCGRDHTHNGYQERLSPQKALARGQASTVIQPGAQKELERRAKETNAAFSMLPKSDAGDFKPVTLDKVDLLVKWAESVGLNAYLGHVELYYGEPRVSIDGYYYLNYKRERPYHIAARPMSFSDGISYALDEGDHGYIARAYDEHGELPEIGIGIVRADELTAMSKKDETQKRYPVVSEHPQRMAEKRAEWQLLRKLIPLEVKE